MKILDISTVSPSIGLPIKAGTLQFMQDAHKESLNAVIKNIVENPHPDTMYILSGCTNSATLPAHNISAGTLYVNGEVFDFAGANFTLTGLQKAYARIETTQFTTNADPVQFTDGVSRNIHNIRKIVIENTTFSSMLPEFQDFITVGAWIFGDTKEVVCDSAYLAKFFDATGLGRLDRKGWAIMNGNNGTVNDNGKVVIAYGAGYTTLGATGGEVNHTLTNVELPVDVKKMIFGSNQQGHGSDVPILDPPFPQALGLGQAHNNMQPYVVRLRIQKI